MGAFLKGAFKWLGIGGLIGIGSSTIANGGSISGGISDFFNTAILVALGIFFIWLMFKLIKK